MLKFCAVIFLTSVIVASEELTEPGKRHSHPRGDYWHTHCWDHAHGHSKDPFCAVLAAHCDAPPIVENGKMFRYTSNSTGSTVSYVCNDGYVMTGKEVIVCERLDITERPKWSKPPTCTKVTCPAIPDIENGFHEATNTTDLGTTVRYFCNEGFDIEDNDTITCELVGPGNNANWTQPLPSCTGTVCLRSTIMIINGQAFLPNPLYVPPTVPPTTTTVITTTTEPQTTTTEVFTTTTITSMPENFTDVYNDTATEFPLTDENTNSSVTLGNASVSQIDTDNDTNTSLTDASNITTTAEPDLSNETSTEQTDTNTVTFTTLPEITTEILTTTTTQEPSTISPYIPITNETFQINDTIIYQCNPGYGFVSTENTVVSSLEATCVLLINKTTTWSSSVICVPECQPVPTIENANRTEPKNTLQGAEVIYSCDTDFEMIGSPNVTCLATGNWSELPYCRGCLNAPEVEHATHSVQYSTSINSTVSYVCTDGYSMLGAEVITCVPSKSNQSPYAEWTKPPTCFGGCGPVPSIENGEHTIPDNFLTGSNVTYSCLNGSNMSGSPDIVCLPTGNWSETPKCSAVCPDLPDIPNSIPTRYVYNETDKVIVTCEEQYILIGNDTLECIGGNWSTPFPVCECQIKPIDIVFIIDGSGSLGLHGFRQTLDFVVDMVKRFPEETTSFGLLTFASDVYRQFYLNAYVNDTAGMIDRIQNTTYPTGGTYTYSALSYAREQMFQEKNGMRPNVTHTAIIVTDGQSNDFNETVHQAELLKAEGVTIYSVGVGLTNQDELNLIASKPSYVFTVDNYDLIDQITGPLAGITCTSTIGNADAVVSVQ